jgi:aspartate aminotransferase
LGNPEGAFYHFPDVSYYFGKKDGETTLNNADEICLYLLERALVALVSGAAFGAPNCIRLSYATSEENIVEACSRIKKALESLN